MNSKSKDSIDSLDDQLEFDQLLVNSETPLSSPITNDESYVIWKNQFSHMFNESSEIDIESGNETLKRMLLFLNNKEMSAATPTSSVKSPSKSSKRSRSQLLINHCDSDIDDDDDDDYCKLSKKRCIKRSKTISNFKYFEKTCTKEAVELSYFVDNFHSLSVDITNCNREVGDIQDV